MSQLKTNAIRHTTATSDAITLASDGTATAKITNNLSNRNLIVNGAMNVSQRGSSFTASDFGLDRWKVQWSGQDEVLTHAKHALTSSDTGPWAKGFRNSLHITNGNQTSGAGAADYANIRYVVEAQDLACSGWDSTSSSSKLTLSFWVKSSVAQNFYGWIYNGGGSKNYVFETGSLTADTWTKITKTIPGASGVTIANDITAGLNIYFSMFEGTDRTASMSLDTWDTYSSSSRTPDMTSTWWTTNDATFEITGVQLEVEDTATEFEHLRYGEDLARCQRYYVMIVNAYNQNICMAMHYGGSAAYGLYHMPVTMRDTPSIDVKNGTNYWNFMRDSSGDNFDTLALSSDTSARVARFNTTADISGTSGHAGWFMSWGSGSMSSADIYCALSAEL